MKQIFTGIAILLCCVLFLSCKPDKTFKKEEISIIPQVKEMTLGESSFRFKKNTKLVVETVEQEMIARQFAERFEKVSGWKLQIVVKGNEGSNQIYFKTEIMMDPEAYSLVVNKDRIEIKAAKPAGFFYAMQTVRQLLPVEFERDSKTVGFEWLVPVVNILDSPQFKWRGFLLDVSRHFLPKKDVLRMIDNLSLHKINTLHLHLVDDQGWRIEIKKYPKLTTVGAWRVDHENLHWDTRPKQKAGEKATYGGFFTQEDIKEMVAYAQQRFITIVPEIEMPAHASSALASYPQFSCTGGPFSVPSGGVWPNTTIYCAGNDSSFLFLQDVLTEVMDLFPSKYIHVGGDEATKTEWEKCPKCQKRIRTEGLKNVGDLQSYFITRIEKFITSKDRILLGWDEILEGGLPPKATVMSWRGVEGGIAAVRQGHDVVMTPTTYCYINNDQGKADQEPPGNGNYLPLSKVYSFNPVPPDLNAEEAKHILGGQANLWSEYVPNLKHAEYMAFPRIAAMSEVLWSPKELRNWEDFSRRIHLFMNRYNAMGVNYSKSAFNVTGKVAFNPDKTKLELILKSEFQDAEIHYTADGSEPNKLSPLYTEPVLLDKSGTIKAIAFSDGISSVKPFAQSFSMNLATGKPIKYVIPCNTDFNGSGEAETTPVNGIRGTKNLEDYQGWLENSMEVIIDLKQPTKIHKVSLGTMQNPILRIFFPKKVDIYVSSDGLIFRKVGESLNEVDPLLEGKQLKDFAVSFDTISTSFVKVVAQNVGKCPKGHLEEGEPSWLVTDEIGIE